MPPFYLLQMFEKKPLRLVMAVNKKEKTISDGDIVLNLKDCPEFEPAVCGAFIMGLEDEFGQVRNASIGKCQFNISLIPL